MSACPYEVIAEAIVAKLAVVPGVVNTFAFRKYARTTEDYLASFKDESSDPARITGWTVTREGFTDKQESNVENFRVHAFVIRGVLSVYEASQSEITFQNMVNAIAEQFRPQTNLGVGIEQTAPVQGRTITLAFFGTEFVHYCELTMEVSELYNAVSA